MRLQVGGGHVPSEAQAQEAAATGLQSTHQDAAPAPAPVPVAASDPTNEGGAAPSTPAGPTQTPLAASAEGGGGAQGATPGSEHFVYAGNVYHQGVQSEEVCSKRGKACSPDATRMLC
jgi:hypothetical protein